jgi:dihydrofolate reductase
MVASGYPLWSTCGGETLKILTRLCTSLDGYVTTPDGWPVQLAFPGWDAGALGFYELQAQCDAVLMGRTTFEPAISAPFWPWGDLAVYVLGSYRPEGTPEHVIIDDDPARLLERLRAASTGRDIHLVGGPRTVETFHNLGALDELRMLVLPILGGGGRQLSPELEPGISLIQIESKIWPAGVVEIAYEVESDSSR